MITNHSIRGSLGLGLSALLFIGCTGDDTDTMASSTESTSESTGSTGTTGTTDISASSLTPGTSISVGSDSEASATDPTATDTDPTATDTDPTSETDPTDTDPTGGVCGDNSLDPGEECDEGELNGSEESMCDENCNIIQQGECGDGTQDVGEECDDGNVLDGDGCSADCTTEAMNVCGDGSVGDAEECDDGNDVPDDGCEADCTISAPGECGYGEQEWDELCDDGNKMNGDGCEDDCTPTPEPLCQPAENYISCDEALDKGDALAPFQALGLACSNKVNESILISNTNFASPDPDAWQIAKGFGTHMEMGELLYSAREGESFVLLSTGTSAEPNNAGVITDSNQSSKGGNGNPDDNEFLPGYAPGDDDSGVLLPQWQKGGNNPGDKIYFNFKTQTPGGVKGYAIDFAFFSSEWPSWYNTQYNDLFVAWQVHEDFTGNISTIGDLPTTITALHPHWTDVMGGGNSCANYGSNGPGYSCDEPQMDGTGFENHAATTWVRINQPVTENTELELYLFLADMGDTSLASAVILDRFRFNCDECIPVDDPKCTGEVPDENCCGVVLPM